MFIGQFGILIKGTGTPGLSALPVTRKLLALLEPTLPHLETGGRQDKTFRVVASLQSCVARKRLPERASAQ